MARSCWTLYIGSLIAGMSQAAYSAELPIHARYPIMVTQSNSSANMITRVELPLSVIAMLHRGYNRVQGSRYQVLDAAGHVMPTRIVTQYQPARVYSVALRTYHWPAQTPTTRAAAANLELQLNQDHAHAWITWPDANTATANKHAEGTDQTWLLAMPNPEPDQQLVARKIVLTWPSSALSIQASVEGSQDLIHWSNTGNSTLLDTGQGDMAPQGAGVSPNGRTQLKQTSIDVDQSYRYWRLSLSAPLALSSATIVLHDAEQPLLQSQQVVFSQEGNTNTWSLSLAEPVAALGFKFTIPFNQVWSLSLSAIPPHIQPANPLVTPWQLLRTQQLSHWQNPPQGETGDNQTLWLDSSPQASDQSITYSAQWQLKGLGPQNAQLAATLYGPSQRLYFIAQGVAPYRLEINGPTEAEGTGMDNILTLPEVLPPTQAATLGTVQIIPPATPWKNYGLWAVLIVAVVGLAIAALRLLRGLDQQPR